MRWRKTHHNDPGLPLIVPLVFYYGAEPWPYQREFAELFGDAAPQWRWVPRFEHLLIDQTQREPGSVPGGLVARLAQIALMAAFRKAREELFEWAARLMGELYRVSTCWRRSRTSILRHSPRRCGVTCRAEGET